MSTTIDERVVEMRFDNKHFENNVQTTMSTLDKLKQKLNLPGAAKGLESINTAAKNVDMSGLGSGVETVRAKFSALEVMGVTALANITNSAVNAGKKMISALTIDPIKTGFQEYETQINATQTILANTKSKGSTIDDVNAALKELNDYADLTIYNFTEMTRNIGTFTAAGVDLETSVNAIQGIANLAAVSGSTSQQASTAMYQLSQALAAGKVQLMDWNSVVNAGMGGEIFQNALKETSELLGTGAQAAIEAQGSFRESLKDGWLTAEVLTETLKKFTTSGAKEYVAEYTGLTLEQIDAAYESAKAQYGEADAIKEASKALAEKSGKSADEIEKTLDLAYTAESAATEVKTFTQLWDVLKESAQSGWSQTWKLLIGDFEEAKALLSPLADFLTGIIGKISDYRNTILAGALGNPFSAMFEKVTSGLDKIKKVTDSVKAATEDLEYFQDIVTRVWRGDFNNHGDNPDRYDLLEAAGYDHRVVQDLVNLGYQHEITMEEVAASHEKFGLTLETSAENTEDMNEALQNLTREELENLGLTDDEIEAFQALQKESKKTGKSIEELADEMSNMDGRSMLIEGFKNIGKSIKSIFEAVGEAWTNIFPPSESIMNLYNAIKGFRDFSKNLVMSEDTADDLRRTLEGVFAILDIITTITGGAFKFAFKAVNALLGMFDMNILDVTAVIGDAIVFFRDWMDNILDFTKLFEKMVPIVKDAGKAIKDWILGFKDAENIPHHFVNGILGALKYCASMAKKLVVKIGKTIWNGISAVLSQFGIDTTGLESTIMKFIDKVRRFLTSDLSFDDIPDGIVSGLVKGLASGAKKVWNAAIEIGKSVLESICNFLGIHSPSTKFIEVGKNIIDGLVSGIKSGLSAVWNLMKDIASKTVEFLGNIDWGSVLTAGLGIGMTATMYKLASALESIVSPLDGLGEVLESVGAAAKGLSFELKTKGLKNIAIAILILAGALMALAWFIGEYGAVDLLKAVGIMILLGVVLAAMAVAMDKLSQVSLTMSKSDGLNIQGIKSGLLGIAAAILMMVIVVKMVGSLSPEQAKQGFLGLAGIIGALLTVLFAISTVTGFAAANIGAFGSMMFKMSVSLLLLIWVFKLISKLSGEEIIKGVIGMGVFTLFVKALIWATKSAGSDMDKVGSMLIKMSIALGIMVGVVKLISMLSWSEMGKGAVGMGAFVIFVGALVAVTKSAENDLPKVGGVILAISTAMLMMVAVMHIISLMSWESLAKGAIGIAAFAAIIYGLLRMVKEIGPKAPRLAGTIVAVSVAIAILAATAALLSFMSIEGLAKGIIAVGLLAEIMGRLIKTTKKAKNCMGNLIVMTVALSLLAASLVILSNIEIGKLLGAATAMGIVMSAFALMAKMSSSAQGSMGSLIVMTVAVGVLAGILYVLARLSPEASIGNAVALSTLVVALSAAMFILAKANVSMKNALKGAVALTAMAIPLMAFVAILAFMPDISSAVKNVPALIGLVTVLALLLIPLTLIGTMWTSALKGIVALTAMAVPLMAFVAVLAFMPDVSGAMKNMPVLLTLMTTMTLLLVPLTLIGTLWVQALAGVLALTAMVVPLMAFVAALAFMPDVTGAAKNLPLLLRVMTHMTLLLVPLTLIGLFGPAAFAGIGALTAFSGFLIAFGAVATAIGALVTKFPSLQTFLDTGIPILEQLASGLGSVIGSFITGFAGEVMTLLPELGTCLSAFMTNATVFIEGAKTVDEKVLAGVGILAGAILALTAVDLINGIISFIQGGSSFADLGTQLSLFMANAMPFIVGASMLNAGMMDGVKALAETVLILTAADVINGLTSWLTGGSSLAEFGAQLGPLGSYLNNFVTNLGTFTDAQVTTVSCAASAIKCLAEAAKTIPNDGGLWGAIVGENSLATFGGYLPGLGSNLASFVTNLGTFTDEQTATVDCAAKAIKTLAEAAKTIPNDGGLWGAIVGENSLATFGGYLPDLGTNLNQFVTNLGTFTDDQVTTITCAANAIKAISDVAKDLPNEGGIWGAIVGENSLATFAGYLPGLGTNLSQFGTNLGTFGEDQISTVDCAAKAIKLLAEAAKTIPNEGSIWGAIVGENSLATFGGYLPDLGTNLASFATNLGTFGEDQITTVNCAANAIKALAEAANSIPKEGGFWASIVGDNSLSTFSGHLPGLGTNLASFVGNLGTFTADQVSTVDSAVNAIKAFAKLGDIDLKALNSNLGSFGDKIVSFGEKLASFCTTMAGNSKDSIDSAVSKLKSVTQAIKNLEGVDASSVKSFADALKTLGENGVSSFVSEFTKNSAKTKVKDAAKGLADQVIKGFEAKEKAIKTAASDLVSAASSKIKTDSNYKKFKSAGSYLVDGFAAGISENDYKAEAKAKAMAKAAAQAAEDALKINSPSKVFRDIGKSVPEGFALGISKLGNLVNGSTISMADLAVDGVRNSISRIASMVNSDIDAQPTIRPVVDLTSVESGAMAIGNLLNLDSSVGVLANVGAVSAMMNRRSQNGSNSDVVSAIRKLGKDLGDLDRNSYNINGITYDDGSNVADAVRSLIRATNIERRI